MHADQARQADTTELERGTLVTDHDRALAEFITDPALAEYIELVPATIDGTECALLVDVSVLDGHATIRPIAVIVNDELLRRLIFGTEG